MSAETHLHPAPGPRRGAVQLERVTKRYVEHGRAATAAGAWSPTWARSASWTALEEIDLDIVPGDRLGLIGPNGAGKSTLLRMVAGVSRPTSGSVRVGGRVASMIDLGLGFHPELTGWENLDVSAALLGLDRSERRRARQTIAAFAGIEEAMDQRLRTYSTGMAARLGFAVATHVDPDVLVVDEVLAVGDREFQQRCVQRILELNDRGCTVLVVSHEMQLISLVCNRAVQLRRGRMVDDGPAEQVVETYLDPSPSRRRPAPSSAARLRDCGMFHDPVRPWDPLEFWVSVDVGDDAPSLGIGIDLVYPTVDPDHVFFSHQVALPPLRSGRHRLRARTDPYPGSAGQVRVIISLLDEDGHRRLDYKCTDFTIAAAAGVTRPLLAAELFWTVRPAKSVPGPNVRSAPLVLDDPVARLRGVRKTYPLDNSASARIALPGRMGQVRPDRCTVALDDLDLDVGAGATLGIIGPNGAGKSTLLRILGRVTSPDSGVLVVKGRSVPVFDLGLGFLPALTGEENLRIAARLLDLRGAEQARACDEAIELSGLGDAVRQPVRTFSSGMRARLGFSLAAHARPDVLLLDETLAVGDEEFRRRAAEVVGQLTRDGAAVVFVSHDLGLVEQVCERVAFVEHGRVLDDGPAAAVVRRHGAAGWAGGRSHRSEAVRVESMELDRHHVPAGGRITITGMVDVVQSAPWVRLELSFRALTDDARPATREEAERQTVFLSTVEPAGGLATLVGRHDYRVDMDRVAIEGDIEVVLSAVDERDGDVISECWRAATIGRPPDSGVVGPMLAVEWRLDPQDGR